jgi:hypothetical protein
VSCVTQGFCQTKVAHRCIDLCFRLAQASYLPARHACMHTYVAPNTLSGWDTFDAQIILQGKPNMANVHESGCHYAACYAQYKSTAELVDTGSEWLTCDLSTATVSTDNIECPTCNMAAGPNTIAIIGWCHWITCLLAYFAASSVRGSRGDCARNPFFMLQRASETSSACRYLLRVTLLLAILQILGGKSVAQPNKSVLPYSNPTIF